ncbi:MAG: phospholipase D family protein [Flavobacteriaceae bacterium]|nr:phospholipase D family protein [Flavobacteriaceae bacterium]
MGNIADAALCDLYVGVGAGRKLMREMHAAKKSIRIVSPYISEELIDVLLLIEKPDLEISLYSMGSKNLYYGKGDTAIKKLIVQEQQLDETAQKTRNQWIRWLRRSYWIQLIGFMLWVAVFWKLKDLQWLLALWIFPCGGIFQLLLWIKIVKKTIYNYHYKKRFPFTIFFMDDINLSPHIYVHSKIYIIDESIAYIGSLNLTKNGMGLNHETRVRSTDAKVVKALCKSIEELEEEIPNNQFDLLTYVANNFEEVRN